MLYDSGYMIMFDSIITALAGYALLALVFVLDKLLVSDKAKKMPPLTVAFYSTATLIPIFLLVPFGAPLPKDIWQWWLALGSGLSFVAALTYMYYAFRESEITHAAPVVGIATTVATVFIARYFLGEALTAAQLAGISILLAGTIFISFEQSARHYGWHRGVLYAFIAGLFFAVSNVTAKSLYAEMGFLGGLVASRGAIGIFGLLLLISPTVRESIRAGVHKHGQARSRASGGFWALFLSDKILGIVGVVLIQYAAALGSVSIVTAVQSFQYALIVIGIFALSRLAPRIFREQYRRGELRRELVGVCLIALGLFLVF